MGGRPLTAMNVMGMPTDTVPNRVINAILRGGATKAKEAKCVLVGGHSIRNPEPIYGLSVTGLVHPRRMMTNAGARPDDWLLLTKPLGTGIVTTGIKRGLTSPALARRTIAIMARLNIPGADLAERELVRAGTDVTGFGLLGHLGSMCKSSGVGAELRAGRIPAISPEVFALIGRDCIPGGSRQNLEAASAFTRFDGVDSAYRILVADAQTSGGLLVCVPPRHLDSVLKLLKRHRTPCAAVIGRIVRSSKPRIHVLP
jgi:selenide,water dikinase